MSKITILDNECATLWFYPESKIVHHEIKKFIFGQQLRELFNQGYETLKKNNAQKWLSDDRNNGPLNDEDSAWCQNDWFPRVVAAGWKFWAIVMPKKVIGVMNMRKFTEDYAKAGVIVNVFSDPEEALKWLKSQ
jgi:hypothetical protein